MTVSEEAPDAKSDRATSLSTETLVTSRRIPISETNRLTQYMPQPTAARPEKLVVKNLSGEETMALVAARNDVA